MTDETYTRMVEASEVTDEVLEYAVEEADSRYPSPERIDWEDVLDRLDGTRLNDDTRLDLGNSYDSPAIRKIKKHVRDVRRYDY